MDNMKIQGKFRIENTTTGEVREVPNTIVTLGKSMLAGRAMSGEDLNVGSGFGWMALGIGSETITAGHTVLGSEYLKYGLGSIAESRTTTTVTDDTATWVGSFGITETKIVNEAGLFNASGLNTGSMLAITNFADISAGSADRINCTWDIKFA